MAKPRSEGLVRIIQINRHRAKPMIDGALRKHREAQRRRSGRRKNGKQKHEESQSRHHFDFRSAPRVQIDALR
jgi:hypothetical protein